MSYLDFFPVPMHAEAAATASVIVGISAIGLAIGFWVAEPRSPVGRALALFLAATGFATTTSLPLSLIYESTGELSWLLRFPVFDMLLIFAGGLWLRSLSRIARPSRRVLIWVNSLSWVIWTGAIVVTVLAWFFPVARATEFLSCMQRTLGCGRAGYWMFGIPWGISVAAMTTGALILSTQRIDVAERVRLITIAVAMPFMAGMLNLPMGYGALSGMLSFLILATGLIRYYSLQGERAQFLSRFLSPEVEKLVLHRGLQQVMRPKALEITVINCDLRGFTRLSQLLASDQVLRLLDEYYDAIGKAVTEFGGTIKDYAGDGVLILVGAPLAIDDHARQGLRLARRLQHDVHQVIAHWAGPELALGMGTGVASGKVIVGAIGTTRMEYTAVGTAVNLASRLCDQARDGEILVDPRTVELSGEGGVEPRCGLQLKGLGDAAHFAAIGVAADFS